MVLLELTKVSDSEYLLAIADGDSVSEGLSLDLNQYLGGFDVTNNKETRPDKIISKTDHLMYKYQHRFKSILSGKQPAKEADQPTSSSQQPRRLVEPPGHLPPSYPRIQRDPIRPLDPFVGVGRNDLDPFSSGGMLLPGMP